MERKVNYLKNQCMAVAEVCCGKKLSQRIKAVRKIEDQEVLAGILEYITDKKVIVNILDKITDGELLEQILTTSKNELVCSLTAARVKNQEVLFNIALNLEISSSIRLACLRNLTDQEALYKIAADRNCDVIGCEAVRKITKHELFEKLALDPFVDARVRVYAVTRITNEVVLEKIVVITKEDNVREEAVKGIHNVQFLKTNVLHDPSSCVRVAAMRNIKEVGFQYQQVLNTKQFLAVRVVAAEMLSDDSLIEMAYYDVTENEIIEVIADKVNKAEILVDISLSNKPVSTKKKAIRKIESKEDLQAVIIKSDDIAIRELALQRVMEI